MIIWLTRLEENNIKTIGGNKPKNIYCHRNEDGEIIGMLFRNEGEPFGGLNILPTESDNIDNTDRVGAQ